MAKRKRRARPLGHITQKEIEVLQDRMNTLSSDQYRLFQEGAKDQAGDVFEQIKGMLHAADALRIPCQCFNVSAKMRKCVCSRTLPGMLAKKKDMQKAYAYFGK